MNALTATATPPIAFTRTGAGPALVVIHGIGGHKEDWQRFATTMASHRTVLAVDMLGFGGSPKSGERITIADQVAAIEDLLDAEGIQTVDLVGNSVGGWVAATFAATHPARTRRLVLVDAAGFEAMFAGEPPVDFYPTDDAAARNLLAYVRHDPAAHTPDAVRTLLADVAARGDAIAAAAVGAGMFASPRLEAVATRVTAPTLVVWGEEDRLFPRAVADHVASCFPGSRVAFVPAASHFPQLDNPAVFERIVSDFLLDDQAG